MKRPFLLLLALVAPAASADPRALADCRELDDPAARLACYDAIPLAADAPAATPRVATAAPPVAAPSAPAASEDRFGLPERKADAPSQLASSVGEDFRGWRPRARIALDNGQVWEVIDGSSMTLRPGRRVVTLRRALLGSTYFLEIEGINAAPRVKRVE